MKRYWWNPVGVLTWSRTGPCQKILWRSCCKPPQKVLALRSWRCSALVLVWKILWDAHRKFLYEDLVRSDPLYNLYRSIYEVLLRLSLEMLLDVLIRGSGMRSWWVDIALLLVPKTSSSCCSSDNVQADLLLFHSYCCCCLYLVHWLPNPHTVWGLFPV